MNMRHWMIFFTWFLHVALLHEQLAWHIRPFIRHLQAPLPFFLKHLPLQLQYSRSFDKKRATQWMTSEIYQIKRWQNEVYYGVFRFSTILTSDVLLSPESLEEFTFSSPTEIKEESIAKKSSIQFLADLQVTSLSCSNKNKTNARKAWWSKMVL